MANMKFFGIFMIVAGLFSLTSLVVANPVSPLVQSPSSVSISTATITGVSPSDPKASTLAAEEAADGNHHEATCTDPDNCCILDFTHVPCAEHKKPVCEEKGCGPVPPTIGFSHASPGSIPLADPTHMYGCVNVLDKNGNDTTYDQFFISHCTANVHSVELFSKSNCQGTRQNQINTAGCYESSISIGSFRVVTVAHDKRGLFDGAQKESKTLTTSTFPSQNKASVTPAEECFDKETGAYILDCDTGISKVVVGDLVKRDVDDAEKGVRRCPPMTGKYHNCTLYPVAVADKMPGLKLGKCWVDTSTTSPESDILEIVCPHLDKRSDSIDDREVISRQDADDAEKGIDRCPPMKGEYKGCSIYPVVGDFQFPGRNLGKCWLPVSPTYPERAVFEIVCPNTNNRSVSIDDRVVPFRRDADDAEQGIDRCPPMTGEFKSCALYLVGASGPPGIYLFQCWLPLSPTDPEGFLGQLVCPIIGTRSVSINGPVVPSCPAHVPKDCTLTPGPKNITHGPDLGVAHYNRTQLCETHPHPGAPKFWWLKCPWNFGTCGEDEDLVCPSIKESSSVDEDIGTSKDIAARNASPQKCTNPDWCININFGESMCQPDLPNAKVLLEVTDEGTYQCRNVPYHLDIQQFQVTYMNSQTEGHDPTYGELSVFNAPNCGGDDRTVTGLPYCTTMPQGWGRILSYRVWLEGACGDTIGPCSQAGAKKRGIDHVRPRGAEIQPRSTVTTKVTAPAASVGVPATVTF